jgi:hypothetical protein
VVGTTLAQAYAGFLADAAHLDRLRPHTLRAYRYELALAAADPRFAGDLAALSLADLEAWIARPPAAPSTVGRRAATFRRFFAWAAANATRLPQAAVSLPRARCRALQRFAARLWRCRSARTSERRVLNWPI